eukprot:s100_g33.t4
MRELPWQPNAKELLSADGLPVPGVLVLDGHSGHRCVEHLADRLPKVLQTRLANKPNLTDEHLRDAVLEACALVDEEFLCWARQHEAMDGSTLLLALVYAEQGGAYRLLVANVGDSRADHKPNRPDEQQRIEALGGVVDLYGVWRVFCPSQVFFGGRAIPRWGLAVSRAFGDLLLKEPQNYGCAQVRGGLVIAEPELRVVELDPAVDRFLVLACDGVWDDSDAAAVCASAAGVELASHSLVRHAFAAGSGDNLTAVGLAGLMASYFFIAALSREGANCIVLKDGYKLVPDADSDQEVVRCAACAAPASSCRLVSFALPECSFEHAYRRRALMMWRMAESQMHCHRTCQRMHKCSLPHVEERVLVHHVNCLLAGSGSSQRLQNYPSAAQSSLKGTAVGASESVKIEWKKLTPQEQRVQVLAGRALRTLNEKAKLLITVEPPCFQFKHLLLCASRLNDSVYGAALALPQVARTAGWSLEYTSLACHSMMFLLTNLLLQGFLLYMLSKELRTLDKFGGQMHLCDFGAHSGECPEGKNCIGPGGTAYTPERLYDWKLWTTRVFVRDSFKALFPDRAEDIEEMVDPGEYGLESYYLRMICCFIFVLGLWPDLAGSWETSQQSHSKASSARSLLLRFVSLKIINFFLILCPKMYIWILTVDIGIVFLMETSEIEDMIINCVALAFILNLDELTTAASNIRVGDPGAGFSRNWFSPGFYGYIIPARLCFLLAVTAFFLGNYYLEACIRLEDGSWVSKDLHLPRSDNLPFLTFLFEPFPRLFPVDTESLLQQQTGVLVVIGVCGTTSAYLFWCASPDAARSETCAGSGSQSNQDFAAGCGLLVIGAFFLCLACQMSAWMENAVKLIQWSCKCILYTPSLFLAPPIIVALRGLATVWGVYVAVLLVTAGMSNYKWSLNYEVVDQEFASWRGNRQFALSPNEYMCLLVTVLMNIWVQGIIYAFCEFVTVYTSQMWYFSGGMSGQGAAPVFSLFRACWVAVRYHLGSIIAGGLKIMVATPFHFTLGWIDAATKSKYNPVGNILGGCCDCCLNVYRSCFGKMTRHAFLDVSLQAMPFNEAAEHVREILAQESTAFSLLTGASWLLQIVGLGLIATVGHIVVQVAIQTDPDLNVPTSPHFVQRPELLSFAGAALALFIGFPFMTLFDIVSDCIAFCRTMQKMRRVEFHCSALRAHKEEAFAQPPQVPPTHVLTPTRWAMLAAAAPQHLHALTTRSPAQACKKTARRALWPRHQNGPGSQPTVLQGSHSSLRRRCGKLLSLLGALLWRRRRRAALGREDVGSDQAGGKGSDAANPSVLTDTICLIPGSAPVTRVEDAPGNARRIYTGIDIRASVSDVWEVLTDYEGLARVVPNLAENSIVEGPDRHGGARLWQIGQASWTICGKTFYFQAGMTLDVRLHPEGVCRSGVKVCGERMDAAHMLSSEVRAHGRKEKLIRDVFPRPFSVAAEGVPVRDITMQNVLGARGDFVHYQGEEMMRLTFAVECQPHWFLPVAPVEGRIATALAENMEAIRDFVEERLDGMESVTAASQPLGLEPETALNVGHSLLPSPSESAWPQLPQEVDSLARAAHSLWDSLFPDTALPQPQPALGAELWCMTEAVADALNRAEMRLMERAEVGVVSENAAGALSSIAASMAEASAPVAATAETAAITLAGLEAETVLTASAVAAIAAIAARSAAQRRVEEAELELSNQDHTVHLQNAWRAVLDNNFLGEPFGFEEVQQRWPRLVQTLGVSEDQALKIIEADATPLLVESDAVSEVLARLAAISSREKALELVHRSPSLLAAAMGGKAKNGIAVSTLVDMLYAGRLYKVLEEEGRSNAGKLAEIELYANLLSAFRPCVDLVLSGHTARDAKDATRRIFGSLQEHGESRMTSIEDCAPNDAIRVLLQRVAAAADPWAYLADQTRAGFSIGSRLVVEPSLTKKILPRLGWHGIVRILDQYLDIVEPSLPLHLRSRDVLAKHCGPLLDHFDLLMPYAELGRDRNLPNLDQCFDEPQVAKMEDCLVDNLVDNWEGSAAARVEEHPAFCREENSYLPKLLPYVDYLIPRLDQLAPHLPLAHPHLPYVLPFMDDLLPYIERFVRFPQVSKNADVLATSDSRQGGLMRVLEMKPACAHKMTAHQESAESHLGVQDVLDRACATRCRAGNGIVISFDLDDTLWPLVDVANGEVARDHKLLVADEVMAAMRRIRSTPAGANTSYTCLRRQAYEELTSDRFIAATIASNLPERVPQFWKLLGASIRQELLGGDRRSAERILKQWIRARGEFQPPKSKRDKEEIGLGDRMQHSQRHSSLAAGFNSLRTRIFSEMVGCHCGGRDRSTEEERGLLSSIAWSSNPSTSVAASPTRMKDGYPRSALRIPSIGCGTTRLKGHAHRNRK